MVTPLATAVLATGATLAAVAAFAGLLVDQQRRWCRSDAALESHFLPDGTPSMTVTAFGDRTAPSPCCAEFLGLAGADSARTEAGKAAT